MRDWILIEFCILFFYGTILQIIPLLQIKKIISALYSKGFPKHPLFTTFSLILTVYEVCNMWNKYWLANKLAKKVYLSKKSYTLLSFNRRNDALHHKSFKLVFAVDESFSFYLGFPLGTFTIHMTAREWGGYFFNSSLPIPPTSQKLRQLGDYCRDLISAHS